MTTLTLMQVMFDNLLPHKGAEKENKKKELVDYKSQVQKKPTCLRAGKENKKKELVEYKSQVQKKLTCPRAGKENTQKEPAKDTSQVQKKLTCLRCCQCSTCKMRHFSKTRVERVLYDPRTLPASHFKHDFTNRADTNMNSLDQ
jgi:hypothetical protein